MAKTKGQSTSIVKQNTTLAQPMEDWEIQLASEAKSEVAKETSGMPRVSHQAGVLKIDGKPVAGNKLTVGIVDFVFTKAYYEGEFDPSVPQTPVCYAFGREEAGMKPHENSPKKQHDQCAGCEWNAFGTAERGRGKRCKDERRLGVVVSVEDPSSIQKADVRALSVPPGSLKNWGKYLQTIPEITPTGNVRAVLTEVSTEPSGGAYALTFKPVAKLAKESVQAIMQRRDTVAGMLIQPYPTIEAQEQKPTQRRKVKGQ